MKNKIEFRCGLIDFQVGRDHGPLNFDPAEYIRSCYRSRMKRVIFTCKDAYGDAYYRSELVGMNPMAGSDYLQAAIDEAKNLGIEIYSYYNIFLDDIYAGEHPEYRIVDSDGNKVIAYDYYKSLCPNTPYIDVIRERIADLVFNYDIDGIFFDITYFRDNNCFCSHCKKQFVSTYGYELRNDVRPGTHEYSDFNEFKRISRAKLLLALTDTVKEIKQIPVIWNGSGSFYLAEPETDEYSDYLTTEFHAPDYLDGIVRAKWMQSRGKGFIMSTPSEMGSWGDWTLVPENTLKSVVCSITANGGGVFFNHTPYPSGDFAKSRNECTEDNIKASFSYLEKYENHLRDAKSAAEAAVILSVESKRFCQDGFNGMNLNDFTGSLKGAVKMMLESGVPFDVVDEKTFIRDKSKYKAAILPNAPSLDDNFIEELMSFEGSIISCGTTGMYDRYGGLLKDRPLDKKLGIEFEGFDDKSIQYMSDIANPLSEGVPDMPILLKNGGRVLNVKAAIGAERLSFKTEPPFEATLERHVYHQHAHPYKKTEFAGIVKKDNCIYFTGDIFKSFYSTASPWLKRLFLNSLGNIYEEPILKIDAPPCVYPTLMKKNNEYILQLININGPIPEASKSFPEFMLNIPKVKVTSSFRCKKISAVSGAEESLVLSENEFIIKDLGVHAALIIETGEKDEK